jgi:hypothetical protein
MVEVLLTAALLAGFVYVFLLATNPKGAWSCPICNFFARLLKPQPGLKGRRQAE